MSAETILITGATGRIGHKLTTHFRAKGWTVIATSRDAQRLEVLARSTIRAGHLEPIVLDIAAAGAASRLLDQLSARGLLPHHLVNNARDLTNLALSDDGQPTPEQWSDEFNLGVVRPYEMSLALALASGSRLASIVNVASIYGVVAANPYLYNQPARQSPVHYGVIKAALLHLTRELAVRLAPNKVRVNAVSYGGVEGRVDAAFLARYAALSPSGKMLTGSDIPGPVDFLTSAGASATTGHNLVVDGGWTIW